jgi:hypothetical protein
MEKSRTIVGYSYAASDAEGLSISTSDASLEFGTFNGRVAVRVDATNDNGHGREAEFTLEDKDIAAIVKIALAAKDEAFLEMEAEMISGRDKDRAPIPVPPGTVASLRSRLRA